MLRYLLSFSFLLLLFWSSSACNERERVYYQQIIRNNTDDTLHLYWFGDLRDNYPDSQQVLPNSQRVILERFGGFWRTPPEQDCAPSVDSLSIVVHDTAYHFSELLEEAQWSNTGGAGDQVCFFQIDSLPQQQ